mmetsp:Transcript_130988/g.339232  ORF Transcript_130988/g.339232 Transcript_130988/m.339232 type:complete len:209 (-) Transcript_130988:272-898(-)
MPSLMLCSICPRSWSIRRACTESLFASASSIVPEDSKRWVISAMPFLSCSVSCFLTSAASLFFCRSKVMHSWLRSRICLTAAGTSSTAPSAPPPPGSADGICRGRLCGGCSAPGAAPATIGAPGGASWMTTSTASGSSITSGCATANVRALSAARSVEAWMLAMRTTCASARQPRRSSMTAEPCSSPQPLRPRGMAGCLSIARQPSVL